MTFRRLLALLLACCAWMFPAPAAERYLPVDEIKPGMVGVGRTVFQGEALEEFTVRILGVLRSTISPQRDLILARLEGGPLAKTGVIAGMSGSPVYIDGRLVGAVSYSLGSFPTEAIAGITPIAEMMESARADTPRPPAPSIPVPAFVTPVAAWNALARRPALSSAFAQSSTEVQARSAGSIDPALATALRRIGTPVTLSGIDPAMAARLLEVLSDAGFVATQAPGGAAAAGRRTLPALRPGDPVGVTLLSGDFNVGATGTVTDVQGDRVLAFGHPFFGLGPVRLPMTRANVHAVLPSLVASTRIASIGETIGTFFQDRSAVLAGSLGAGPDTIPVTLGLTNQYGQRRELRLSLIEDPFFTPILSFVAVGSALSAYERDVGTNTYALRGRLQVRGYAPIVFDDVVTGDTAAASVASSVAMPLAALVTNDREPVRIESVSLEIVSAERARVSSIERVWLDAGDIRPGRTVPLKILLRPYRGPDEVRTLDIEIPLSADGPLTLVVADAARLGQYEQRDGQTQSPAPSVAQLIAQINKIRRTNRIYVRLFARESGATVAGAAMPGLPRSVLAVMEGDKAGSGTSSIGSAVVGTWDIPVDHAVSGIRTLSVNPVPFARVP